MAETVIKKAHWELIIDRFHEGRCVPFLGAAANVANTTRMYDGLPLGAEVAHLLIDRLKIDFKGRDDQNLARVALQCQSDTDRERLVRSLMEILPDAKRSPSPLLETLAKLRPGLIVTTNYDRLLERALKAAKRDQQVLHQTSAGFADTPETKALFEELEGFKGTLIYKIHGSFTDWVDDGADDASLDLPPIIITEDDYIEFLTVVGKVSERIGVPKLIIKRLTPNTLLFLGYSLEDWDFRTIYKGMIEALPPHQARKSFAIQWKPPEFWVEFWQHKGVLIYDMDLYDFADELLERYQKKYGKLS